MGISVIGWLNVLGMFVCGFLIVKLLFKALYGFLVGVMSVGVLGGLLGFLGCIYGVFFKGL